jgi:hypothetical protein
VKLCIAMGFLLRIIAIFLAIAGLCLYENEENKLDDWIISWWIKLDDAAKSASSKTNLFISWAAGVTSSFFDRLLGPNLLSIRTVVVGFGSSVCLTYASMIFFGSLVPLIPHVARASTPTMSSQGASLIGGLAWTIFSIYPVLFENWYLIAGWVGFVVWKILWPVLAIGLIVQHAWGGHFFERYIIAMSYGLTLSIIPDLLFVAINRKLLRDIKAGYKSFLSLVALLIGNLLLALLIVAAPITLMAWLSTHFEKLGPRFLIPLTGPLLFSSVLNCVDIICALLVFIVAFFLLIYRYIFWPLISRPFYGVATIGILRRRGQFWAAAVILWNNHFILQFICR